MFKITAIATAFLAVAQAGSYCDQGWQYFASTNSCYKHLDTPMPWTMAEFKCLFQGAHHVSINTAAENDFIHELVNHKEIWTGAAYFGSNPVYINSDRVPFGSYERWETGRRPPMNRARRCIKMNTQGLWFNSCCKKVVGAVCKKASTKPSAVDATDFRRMMLRH